MPNKVYTDPMRDPEGYLTIDQFNDLLKHCNSDRDELLLHYLFYTGRRVSEIVRSVRPCDLNYKDNMIRFNIKKRKKPLIKWINVNSKVLVLSEAYIDKYYIHPDDWLFPINRFRVDQIVKKIGIKAGMEYVGKKKLHAHTFRHSYAVLYSKKIKNIHELKRLQSLMGHSNIATTSYYLEHYNPEAMKSFVEDVEDID